VGSMAVSWIVFACVFGGSLLGLFLCSRLPEHHLSTESKDVVKVGTGLIATMSALVLGLLIASVKGSYDTQHDEVTQMSAKVIVLDRALARYGPESRETRDLLLRTVVAAADQVWPPEKSGPVQMDPRSTGAERLYDSIQGLSPGNEVQRSLKADALSLTSELAKTRWLLFEQRDSSIPMPLLVVLVFWLTILFMGFSLFARYNTTVIVTLLVCAISVSSAVFLILEMDRPFDGMIRISDQPLRAAIALLGR
jgi:hypothetical protein